MEHIRIPKVENVKLVDRVSPRKSSVGTLYLTATHSIYVENHSSSESRKETWVLHSLVSSVERQPITASGCPLVIHCKNFQLIHFVVPQERDCQDIEASLQRLSRPESYEELYCFSYNPNAGREDRRLQWDLVNAKADYSRMGLPNSLWKLSAVNREYKVSDTYPAEVYVPKSATAPVLVGSSKFRSRGRFPALAYYCKENHAAICRSSQPLSGFSARCLEDEQLLEAVVRSNPRSHFMYVVDTRPKLNAMANRAAGKGYENEDNYSNIKFQFLGIENIHVMRNSQQKMLEVCALRSPSSMSDFLEGLESSGWLRHIKAVLDAGIFIAKAVAEEGVSVLVHCSDGWDRTAQVCSVACVLLDPFYRTLKGFMKDFVCLAGALPAQEAPGWLLGIKDVLERNGPMHGPGEEVHGPEPVLIERDWVSFGHKFSHRYGHLDGDPKEVSPILDQFLECVWQLMEQFPCAFQFNERFLISIHHHVYSCQYGNLIGNNQRERIHLGVREQTHSVWAHLWAKRCDYISPLYRPDHSQTQGVLRPATAPYCFKFWRGLYNRFDTGMHPRQSVEDFLMAIQEETQQLEDQLTSHEQKISRLEQEKSHQSASGLGYSRVPDVVGSGVPPTPPCSAAGHGPLIANTPQDYSTTGPCQQGAPESHGRLILAQDSSSKASDASLGNGSDQESGIGLESSTEQLDCPSPLSEDPDDLEKDAYSAA